MGIGGGDMYATPLEMAAAYAMFGNNGYYFEPYCYYKVTNKNATDIKYTRFCYINITVY